MWLFWEKITFNCVKFSKQASGFTACKVKAEVFFLWSGRYDQHTSLQHTTPAFTFTEIPLMFATDDMLKARLFKANIEQSIASLHL